MNERLMKPFDLRDLRDLKKGGSLLQNALASFIETGDPTHLNGYITDRKALFYGEEPNSIDDTFDQPQPIEQVLRSAIYLSDDPEAAEYEVAQTMRLLWDEYASLYELQTSETENIREADQSLAGTRYWIVEELLEYVVLPGTPTVQT